jgi:dihydroneopterin aldolase
MPLFSRKKEESDTVPRFRPQRTHETLPPPPIQPSEISNITTQIADLEHCFENKELFDFLISDVDRNRLVQISQILAESGAYAEMQRVTESREKLDGLIARRMQEQHDRNRTGTSLEEILRAAMEIDPETESIQGLRSKIEYLDYNFFAFEKDDFDTLLQLSERTDILRAVLKNRESQPDPIPAQAPLSVTIESLPIGLQEDVPSPVIPEVSPRTDISPVGARIEPTPGDTPPDGDSSPVPSSSDLQAPNSPETNTTAIYAPIVVEEIPSPAVSGMFSDGHTSGSAVEVFRIFSSAGSGVAIDEIVDNMDDFSSDWAELVVGCDIHPQSPVHHKVAEVVAFTRVWSLRRALRGWWSYDCERRRIAEHTHRTSVSKLQSVFRSWRLLVLAQSHRRTVLASSSLRAWRSRTVMLSQVETRLQDQGIREISGPVFKAWEATVRARADRIFLSELTRREVIRTRVFRSWFELSQTTGAEHFQTQLCQRVIKSLKHLVDEVRLCRSKSDELSQVVNYRVAQYAFTKWVHRYRLRAAIDTLRRNRMRRMANHVLRDWHTASQVHSTTGSDMLIDASPPPESVVAFDDDIPVHLLLSPTRATSARYLPTDSDNPITVVEEVAGISLEDLKKSTQELIVQAQVFLSRRTPIPGEFGIDRSLVASKRPLVHPQERVSQDCTDYFATFNQRWKIESDRWVL